MLVALAVLIPGFVFLYFGAEWLVRGAADVASHLKLSKTFVGLTLVALGTSAPEFFVNVIAAINDSTEFALSNVAGSNLTNLCIGFGLASLFCEVPIYRNVFFSDLVIMLLATCVVVVSFLLTKTTILSFWALLPFLVLIVFYLRSLTQRRLAVGEDLQIHMKFPAAVGLFFLGVTCLYLGGEMVYRSALDVAKELEIPETVIGLTVVACGTSIPDVTASVIAARRREFGIAVGNLLGSNISNILIVLGGTLLVAGRGLQSSKFLIADYSFIGVLCLAFLWTASEPERITRAMGVGMLVAFGSYYGIRIWATM